MMNVHLDVESSHDFNEFDVPCLFSFDGPEGQVRGCGADAPVPRGPAKTLAGRIAALVLKPGDLVGGALPFSKEEADCLWQVSPMRQVGNAPVTGHLPLGEYALTPEPWAEDYAAMVEQALHYLAAQSPTGEALKKISAGSDAAGRGAASDPDRQAAVAAEGRSGNDRLPRPPARPSR